MCVTCFAEFLNFTVVFSLKWILLNTFLLPSIMDKFGFREPFFWRGDNIQLDPQFTVSTVCMADKYQIMLKLKVYTSDSDLMEISSMA